MSKQNKVGNEEKLKATREAIYKAFHDVWLNAEGLDKRALEHKTYQLMNKLNEIGGM